MKQIVTLFFQNSWRQNVNLFDSFWSFQQWFNTQGIPISLFIKFFEQKKMKKTNGFAILVGYLELKHCSLLMHIIYIFNNVLKDGSNVSIFKINKRNTCIMIKSVFIETMYTYF